MLFQGEEYGSSRPFLFFADHSGALGDQVRKGRFEFLAQFPSMRSEESRRALADPTSRETFERCKLDPEERVRNSHVTSLYRDLLALRRTDAAFAPHRGARVHGAVLGPEAFVLRFSSETSERLLVVNLGRELAFRSIPEPLIAPPRGEHWEVLLATEHTRYGGDGAGEVDTDEGWSLGAHRATVLRPPLGGAA
jgi:maltooligosyltrehalose trehalohydrolase